MKKPHVEILKSVYVFQYIDGGVSTISCQGNGGFRGVRRETLTEEGNGGCD